MKPRNCPVTVPTRVVNLERYLEKKNGLEAVEMGETMGVHGIKLVRRLFVRNQMVKLLLRRCRRLLPPCLPHLLPLGVVLGTKIL